VRHIKQNNYLPFLFRCDCPKKPGRFRPAEWNDPPENETNSKKHFFFFGTGTLDRAEVDSVNSRPEKLVRRGQIRHGAPRGA